MRPRAILCLATASLVSVAASVLAEPALESEASNHVWRSFRRNGPSAGRAFDANAFIVQLPANM